MATIKPNPENIRRLRVEYGKETTEEDQKCFLAIAKYAIEREEVEMVFAMRIEKLSIRRIANELNRDKRYVERILDKIKTIPQLQKQIDESFGTDIARIALTKNNIEDAAKEKSAMILNGITGEKIEDASIGDMAKLLKTTHDIYRLESGQSTGNVAVSVKKLKEGSEEDGKRLEVLMGKIEGVQKVLAAKGINMNELMKDTVQSHAEA